MRRAKPISVKVKAPSRGLVTRLPSELADMIPPTGGLVPVSIFLPSTMRRAASVASNVRYEDGVVAKAPGYQTVKVSATILNGFIAQWNLDELSGTRFDSSGNSHNLTEVDGFDPLTGLVLTVGVEGGRFNNAALFPSLQFILIVDDFLTVDATLGSGLSFMSPRPVGILDFTTLDAALSPLSFYSPRATFLHDGVKPDSTLSGGIYTETSLPVSFHDAADDISSDSALSSGVYIKTAVPASFHDVADDVTSDSALSSGTYTLVVVTEADSSVADDITIDSALGSTGAYTKTIVGPINDQDNLLLTAGLNSGNYG